MKIIPVLLAATSHSTDAAFDIGTVFGVGHKHDGMKADNGFGSGHLESVYTAYLPLPTDEASLKAKGWTKHDKVCDEYMGYPWTFDVQGPSISHPLVLYTTKMGSLSGMATMVRDPSSQLSDEYKRYVSKAKLTCKTCGPNYEQLSIAFRKKGLACDVSFYDSKVFGDRLVLNPHGASDGSTPHKIPVEESVAKTDGWEKGSCFDGMGTHWFYDTGSKVMTWNWKTLLPVVAMYHEGKINAVFFNAPIPQASSPPKFGTPYDRKQGNGWESMPLPPQLMCANACSKTCPDRLVGPKISPFGSSWATQHIYFQEAKKVKCSADLWCGSDIIDGKPRNPFYVIPLKGNCCERSFWESSARIELLAEEGATTEEATEETTTSWASHVNSVSMLFAVFSLGLFN
jgi:hypothetical protein